MIKQNLLDIEFLLGPAGTLRAKVTYQDLHARQPQLDAYTQGRGIVLDTFLNRRQQRCVLAEELGHVLYPPGHGHVSYHLADSWGEMDYNEKWNLRWWVSKDEQAALRWATALLIPDCLFWEFAEAGPRPWWEWLECFDVEDWFMRWRMEFARQERPFKWRELVTRIS